MAPKRLANALGRVAPHAEPQVNEPTKGPTLETVATPEAAPRSPGRKNATTRQGLRRVSTFRSISSLLLLSGGKQPSTINVLRMSLEEMHERVRYHWVLHPLSNWKTLWDLISASVVIFYSWMIPFMLCFDWYTPPSEIKTLLKVLDVWGCLDIMLRFRTGIVEYGVVVMNPTDIRRAYAHSIWFPIDLVSTIPFEYLVRSHADAATRKSIKMIKYVKLPRLLRIGRLLKYVRRYKRYSSMTIALNALLFLSHVAACVWVALLGPCDGDEAATEPRCQSGEEINMYWIAFHHGIVSLLGISANHIESADQVLSGAYHKVSASVSSSIYLWGSVVSLLGAVITAVLFGTIINLVQSWNRVENTFRKKMDQITHEMEALSLPKPIRARVLAYYDYLWLNNRTFSEQLNLLKDEGMSLALRQQIAIYLFKDHLQKIPFFQLATDSVLGTICMQLHQIIYMPDDYIIREGDIGRELFMIVKGIVRVMPPKNAVEGQETKKIFLGEGDFFGEIAVVMEVERTRSVRAECVSELCILSREGFDKILVEFPEFATAMKRLIIKRVSEMWANTDGRENIEKMTKLADYQMKKKVAAYNHVKKLRNTAHMLQTFAPRLSNVVKQPVPPEVLGISPSELGSITSPNSELTGSRSNGLEAISESDRDGETAHRKSALSDATQSPAEGKSNAKRFPPLSTFAALAKPGPSADLANPPRLLLRDLEDRITKMEAKIDGGMQALDETMERILVAINTLRSKAIDS